MIDMEECTCHGMLIDLLTYFVVWKIYFLSFYISFKIDFHKFTGRTIVKRRERAANTCVDQVEIFISTAQKCFRRHKVERKAKIKN